MKRIALLAVAAALLLPCAAQAQQFNLYCLTGTKADGVTPNWQPASSTNPCPTTATISGSVTANTTATASATPTAVSAGTGKPLNISLFSGLFVEPEIGGNLVPAGHGVAANAMRVELPTDGTGVVGLNAGSNLIGHVDGAAASGASVSGNPLLQGGRAQNAEPTAVTNGQAVDFAADLTGKQIISPYANKENFISGCNSATGTSGTSVIAAQGASVKIYVNTISVANTGASTSLMTIQIDPAGTPSTLWQTISTAGGGSNITFPVPLVVTANKAVGFTAGTGSTTQYVCISGYTGS